ncbi:MAG: hypothetical protein JWM16_3681 [Verrucomicrobiales bacterium]|nr:hypothetical protein [Verrucomicrobiales bacterium]
MKRLAWKSLYGVLLFTLVPSLYSQIDDSRRELIQLGYNQQFVGHAPLSAYAFYFLNQPNFYRSNVTLRLAVAPVYLDSEVGFTSFFGPNTHLGVGLSGGGYADSYSEIRGGKWWREESFTGHGGGASVGIYHLFNPGQRIPLYGIVRNELHYTLFERDEETMPSFILPNDRLNYHFRAGFRWGGREPVMTPALAMELSAWYEGQFRTGSGIYGFGDRKVNPDSHLFWTRGLIAYTFPERKDNVALNLTLGTSLNVDRFSAYRLGGVLPLASEFPLSLPGYYYQEINAEQFVLLGGAYTWQINELWSWLFQAATAGVDYPPGLQQPGHFHSGVGTGVGFRSPSGASHVILSYGYGIDALRTHGRGSHSIGLLFQFDFERTPYHIYEPGENPLRSRGLERLFNFAH